MPPPSALPPAAPNLLARRLAVAYRAPLPRRSITSLAQRRHPAPFHRTMASRALAPRWSHGTDAATAHPQLARLVAPTGAWTLRADGAALERALAFKTFKAAWVRAPPCSVAPLLG